ncbi:MAG: [protein-PII] uridylyltransferase, partial [Gammaproteobacteria bacterium]|nr:[protein-PII] uridylyltransferase [Gammaproteobacteria bacterium]
MHLARTRLLDARDFAQRLAASERPIEVFRAVLSESEGELHAHHLQGTPAADIVHGRAWLIDQILHFAWKLFASTLEASDRISLVAVGGYGRGELHPCSDIDLMLLVHGRPRRELREFSETLLRFLWDIGLDVGHSVRTVADCVREARRDITIATNLMEARHLEGDLELVERMKASTAPGKLWPARKFFRAKLSEQLARHERYEDTAYNLEPNLKESPGGLRDIQMIAWVAQRHFGCTELRELIDHDFLTDEEYRTLIRGRNFLWRLRNGLHFLAGR